MKWTSVKLHINDCICAVWKWLVWKYTVFCCIRAIQLTVMWLHEYSIVKLYANTNQNKLVTLKWKRCMKVSWSEKWSKVMLSPVKSRICDLLGFSIVQESSCHEQFKLEDVQKLCWPKEVGKLLFKCQLYLISLLSKNVN